MINGKFLVLDMVTDDASIELEVLNEIENIANLVGHSKNDIRIHTRDNVFVLNTFGCFLDKCNEELRENLIDKLVEVQQSDNKDYVLKIKKYDFLKEDLKYMEELFGCKLELVEE